jgi:hypothetical protein
MLLIYTSQHLTLFYWHFLVCEQIALPEPLAELLCWNASFQIPRFPNLLTRSPHFLPDTQCVSSLETSTFLLFCCLPCFVSRTICFIHTASSAAHMAATSWNNRHFVWTAAHIPYPTMMVEFGKCSLSSSVWHMSSATLTSKPKPVPSVCLCSVSDRATWTSEALHDAGTHSAQWMSERWGWICRGWRWRSES